MQAEMKRLFAEGGVMQQGGTVDPVSGNEVPPGAMQEEVRDDIDAKLSEGEFVFPADVVRFYGLEKLMMMRDKAKAGLKRMSDIGQMGNAEEVEDGEALFGDEEMDDDAFSNEIDSIMAEDEGDDGPREYNQGGYVVPQNQQKYSRAPMKGFEMVPMVNDAGQTIFIPFINGVAQLGIPTGYRVKDVGATSTTPATPTVPTIGGGDIGGGDSSGGGGDSGIGGGGIGGGMSVDDAGLATGTTVSPAAVGIVGTVMGMMGIPGGSAVAAGKGAIASALSGLSTTAAASSNQAMMAAQMGLTPSEAATTTGVAATASAVDSLSSSPVGTAAATPGAAGTGGSAASAAAAAASAAAAAGMSAEAQGAASQAAATAAVNGASPAAAAAAGANAAATADQGDVAEGGAVAAAGDNAAAGIGGGDSSAGAGAGAPGGGNAAGGPGNSGDGGTGDSSTATDGGGGGGGGAGGCFLTTAAVEHMGHNDDGQLLNTLRDFRDTYMRKNKEASKDVAWYYENAPKIVKALDEHPDAKKIYRKMYNRFIMPSYLAIKMGKDEVAYGLYKRGINFARQEAGIKNEDIEPRYGKHGTTDADVKKHTGLGAKPKK
jgi:hypothetical protein